MREHRQLSWVLLLAASLVSTGAAVAEQPATDQMSSASDQTGNKKAYPPEERVNYAVVAVGKMKQDARIADLLPRAKGVLIVPHYVKAAAVVGGQGGSGVLLVRSHDKWSDPAFYTLGGASIGAQLGGGSGSMALLLMSDKAVDTFENHPSKWSLNGSAGLTVVDYSAGAAKTAGEGDVVVWSDTKGLFGGAAVGVQDIRRDEKADRDYYGNQQVSSRQILTGAVRNPHRENAQGLQDVLPLRVASK
jgi:SH3 domain-containing YSC84-like protein 1